MSKSAKSVASKPPARKTTVKSAIGSMLAQRATVKLAAGSMLAQRAPAKRVVSNFTISQRSGERAPKAAVVKVVAARGVAKLPADDRDPSLPGGGDVKARTLRLDEPNDAGLRLLHAIFGVPVNRLVNEAVGEYIARRAASAESRLSNVVDALKAYREKDPDFAADWRGFIEGERLFGKSDPAEGVPYLIDEGADAPGPELPPGPTLSRIRQLLRG